MSGLHTASTTKCPVGRSWFSFSVIFLALKINIWKSIILYVLPLMDAPWLPCFLWLTPRGSPPWRTESAGWNFCCVLYIYMYLGFLFLISEFSSWRTVWSFLFESITFSLLLPFSDISPTNFNFGFREIRLELHCSADSNIIN